MATALILLLPIASLPGTTRAWSLSPRELYRPVCSGHKAFAAVVPARTALLCACEAAADEHAAGEHFQAEATQLLDLLEVWMRRQAISSVLSRSQAAGLLEELRNDRRFWAQQRKQFTRVWTSIVEGLRQETRPLSAVLGDSTSARLLDAFEEMDEEPAMVDAILRSEVVEKMLGHVLYEGIVEFLERADLLGNLIKGLPILGPLRQQAPLAPSVAPAMQALMAHPHASRSAATITMNCPLPSLPPFPRLRPARCQAVSPLWRGRWQPAFGSSSSP